MAVEYFTPGVYVEEISSGIKPMTAAPTHIVGFLGESRKGLLNKPIMVTSWNQYFDNFIGYTLADKMTPRGTVEKDIDGNIVKEEVPFDKVTDLDWGVYTFFANGGAKCYVVSVNHTEDNSSKLEALKKDLAQAKEGLEKAKDKEKDPATKKVEEVEKQITDLSTPKKKHHQRAHRQRWGT
jgi:hypothetical protein